MHCLRIMRDQERYDAIAEAHWTVIMMNSNDNRAQRYIDSGKDPSTIFDDAKIAAEKRATSVDVAIAKVRSV